MSSLLSAKCLQKKRKNRLIDILMWMFKPKNGQLRSNTMANLVYDYFLDASLYNFLLIKMNELSGDNVPTRTLLSSESCSICGRVKSLRVIFFSYREDCMSIDNSDSLRGIACARWVVKVVWLKRRSRGHHSVISTPTITSTLEKATLN